MIFMTFMFLVLTAQSFVETTTAITSNETWQSTVGPNVRTQQGLEGRKASELPGFDNRLPFVTGQAYVEALAPKLASSRWFDKMNQELTEFQQEAADLTWKGMIGVATGPTNLLAIRKNRWREWKCKEAISFSEEDLDDRHQRMIYILCRGPRYTYSTITKNLKLRGRLGWLYETTMVCLRGFGCQRSEPDLDLLMRENRDPETRLAVWQGLRDSIGPRSRNAFEALIILENQAARASGYSDIGQCWREELETPNLIKVVDDLFNQVAPLYQLIHAFVRYRLGQFYGERMVPPDEPIPAHLLGNMWSSAWDGMMDIVSPVDLGLDAAVGRLFPTAEDMLRSAEDYYASLGLPRMTRRFWEKSFYSVGNNSQPTSCHGTAANLFKPGDVRMLLCTRINWEDFYVVHHEMGHIQYFMAYEGKPMIFQEGANSAVQETIGDAVMLAVASPEHLFRKGILDNRSTETEMTLMLTLALNKIPQLAYGFILDKWRWDIMSSKVEAERYNELWWKYRRQYQGVRPPVPRYRNSLDPMSKFHVADNTPYIRYFLSGFLQFQFLDVMCTDESKTTRPLHKCDLYGNKAAGEKLRSLMENGSEKPWNEALEEFSNGKYTTVSAEPLLRYFSPLMGYLKEQLNNQGIPIGW